MQFKLRNRLRANEKIAGATIRFTPATGNPVSLVTDAQGAATLDLKTLLPGNYTCTVTAPRTFSDPVGPALLAVGHQLPDRVYRPASFTITRTATGLGAPVVANPQHASVSIVGDVATVSIQPVWMKSAANSSRAVAVSMVVIHHTACALGPAVSTFLAEKAPHYMIDTDGQIVKWVQDSRAAWHAGVARWGGHSDINSRSIGIEIVHVTGQYPRAQYTALLDLLTRISAAYPGIDAWNMVGHSDVGTNAAGRLGRKSGDPGMQFEWSRLETQGFGMIPQLGPLPANIYAGVFVAIPNGSLRRGDNDAHHRFNGSVHASVTGTPVRQLQQDLVDIGYSIGTPDGDFGERTHHAVIAFQEHFFAGGRGHKNPDGRVDRMTAERIRNVADQAPSAIPATTAAAGGSTGP